MPEGTYGSPEAARSAGIPSDGDITGWLLEWNRGDAQALAKLMPLVYDELRRIAARCLRRERPDHTLETAGLIHETYLKFLRQERTAWRDRDHFFCTSARLMRQILVDYARRRQAKRRYRLASNEEMDRLAAASPLLTTLDEGLSSLMQASPECGRVVELRLFGGLSHEEVAATLTLSVRTVKRRWRLARAWLHEYMTRHPGS